jgi:hypothetical protein
MKVEMIETFNFQPEIIFTVLTDIPHHVDWMDEPVELVSLSDGPAKLGTKWEQNADRSGKKLVTLNTCNIFEKNKKFGWVSEKPFQSQVTFLLESNQRYEPRGLPRTPYSAASGGVCIPEGNQESTELTWIVESKEAGIVQLAEPMLVKQTDEMIRKSMIRLKEYLQTIKL